MERPVIRRGEAHLAGSGATVLFRRSWLPEEPERALLLVHGFAEHSGRYEHAGSWLAERGCAVHAYDQRGHGRSDGPRGHVRRFDDYLDDLDAFHAQVAGEHPGLPLFALGHSMGGLVLLRWLEARSPALAGAVSSAAALEVAGVPSGFEVAALRLLRRLLPRVRRSQPIAPEALSRDPEVGRAYRADPLIFQFMTLSLAAGFLDAARVTLEQAARVRVPLLLLHGAADPLVLASGSRAFQAALGSRADLRIYDELRHEILNEPEREQVLADLFDWIRKREGGA